MLPFQREFESDFTNQDFSEQQVMRHEHEATRAAIGKLSNSLSETYNPHYAATGFRQSSLYEGFIQFFQAPTDQLNRINRLFKRSSTDSRNWSDSLKGWAEAQGRLLSDRDAIIDTVTALIGKAIVLSPIYYWGPNIVRFEAAENRLFPSGSWRAPLRTNPIARFLLGSPLARASVLPVFTASLLGYEYYARAGRDLQQRESQRLPGTRANDERRRAQNYVNTLRTIRDADYERVFSTRPDDDVGRSDEILDDDDGQTFSVRAYDNASSNETEDNESTFSTRQNDALFNNNPNNEQTFSIRQNDNESLSLNAVPIESVAGAQDLNSSVSMSDSERLNAPLDI